MGLSRFIIKARWVIPVDHAQSCLPHAAILVEDGRIRSVCAQSDLPSDVLDWPVVDCQQHAVIPGLVNTHTHAAMNLLRGYADDLALMPWLQQHIWPAEQQWVSPAFVEDGSLLACAEMLSGGVTTFNDMYFFPQATIHAALRSGMRASIGLTVLEFPTNYASHAADYIRLGTEVRDQYKHEDRLQFCFAPHAPYTVSDKTFTSIATLAEQLNLGIHTHLHETRAEIAQSLAEFGVRPLARLQGLGVIGPTTLLAHGVHLETAELEQLSIQGAHIAHCPSSNLKLASGIAPISAAMRAGVNVALGTDGAASNNRVDLWQEMRTAALLAKVADDNAESLSAYTALKMATLGGAQALGLHTETGSIETGKLADLVAVKLDAFHDLPCYDPVSHVVYVASREQVTHTWVQGQLCYERLGADHWFAGFETEELTSIAQQWQLKIQAARPEIAK